MAEHDWSRDWYCTRCGKALEESLAAPVCAHAGPGAGIAGLAQGLLSSVARIASPVFAAGDAA